MIDYILAKALKDAGFPQTNDKTCKYLAVTGTPYFSSRPKRKKDCCAPFLEELIEACKGDFFELKSNSQKTNWLAVSDKVIVFGSTPSIAVAKLYIALNTKTV